ncbi:MAG: RNA polymerase sigma factor [Planctomycetia bacterium]
MPIDAVRLAELIERRAGALELWVRGRCAAPEDAVQEAFCRLAVQEPIPDDSTAWLFRVCRNLADKQRRADGRRQRRERLHAVAPPDDASDPLEVAETLAAVEALADELREPLVARLWGGLSLTEIGVLCGTSTATAFRRYNAALDALRTALNVKGYRR